MNRYLSIFKIVFLLINANFLMSQTDTSRRVPSTSSDTSKTNLNMDAVYNRPFLKTGKFPVAIGGYLEANTDYGGTDGISDGFRFQMRRMTLFFSSTIGDRIKFMSELEFEEGTKQINIEFAAMDIEFHPLLNLRGGIIMNPIGSFNQNHDGPRWEFIDRPTSSITVLPATLSNVGFGIHGKYYSSKLILGYEAYLTNGFDESIISNADNRTSLSAGKQNLNRFDENHSGQPMFTGKIALKNRKIGELGLSAMHGAYNKFIEAGLEIGDKRNVTALAVDFNTTILNDRLYLNSEFVKLMVDVPETYSQQYGNKQNGFYLDCIYTLIHKKILDWKKAKVNLGFRLEHADYNQGKFRETGTNIGDSYWGIVPTISFRPVSSTVLRFNYRYEERVDILGNPPSISARYQFGFSTYF